jgi:hypothetical protein
MTSGEVAAVAQVDERRPASIHFEINTGFHSVICNDGLPSFWQSSRRPAGR